MAEPQWNRRQVLASAGAAGAGLATLGWPIVASAQAKSRSRWALHVGAKDGIGYNQAHAEATNSLADQGIDVFTMHVHGPKVIVETAAKRGKMVCGYHACQAKFAPNAYLTGAERNWVTAYTVIVEAARSGKPRPHFIRGGLKEGYVKPSPYGSMVSEGTRRNADAMKAAMHRADHHA